MCKNIDFIRKNIQTIITIVSILGMALFWVFTINSTPARIEAIELRVSNLERDVSDLKTGIAEQNAKLSLIIDSVYQIRNTLMNK